MQKKYRWLIGVATAVAGSTLAVATATGAFSGSKAVPSFAGNLIPSTANANAGVAAPDATQTSAFQAFARPARTEDSGATAASLLEGLARSQQRFAVNPSLGRAVYTSADTQLYVYPGRGVVCFGAVSTQYGTTVGCTQTTAAVQQGLGSQITVGGVSFVQGVLPAGAHDVMITDSSGAQTPVSLTSDGGYAVQLAVQGTLLSYADRSGTPRQQQLH